MTLLRFIARRSWALGAAAAATGLAGGACAAGLIALINRALSGPEGHGAALAGAFAALVAARIASGAIAQILLSRFSQRVLADLYRDLSRRALALSLQRLEAIGLSRLLVALTDDVAVIGWAIQNLPGLVINLGILSACAVYLGWLSWPVLVALLAFVALGTAGFKLLLAVAARHWQTAWAHRDRLIRHLRALTEGAKELKLHAPRRAAFVSGAVEPAVEALRQATVRGTAHQVAAGAFSQALFFAALGLLLFSAPGLRAGQGEALTGYLLVMIYMMSPLWGVIDAWPILARGGMAVERVTALTSELGASAAPAAASPRGGEAGWERLELKGVAFAYPEAAGSGGFVLGPLDFALRPGEIVFVAGGNGSGKSTFAKVLTGLYAPAAGEIRLDGRRVGAADGEWYRSHFSAIFSDFYLFDRLHGLDAPDLDARARAHLARLELEGAVQVEGGAFSSTALSSGQRKRLALLTALLEDRPIYVLDEWAADQDPHYRAVFYTTLLPDLRRRGKAVVVISHDDRYYACGDRTVRLEYGQICP